MASIYLKEAEQTCILAPREGMMRPINTPASWTEARIGMLWGGVSTGGDNVQNVNETVTLSTYLDRMSFGLKTNDAGLPGELGTDFIGVSNWGNAVSATGNRFSSTDGLFNNSMMAVATVGTSFNLNYTFNNNADMTFGTVTGSTNYCGFYSVKIVVNSPGAASQTVTITVSRTSGFAGPYGVDELRTRMKNSSYSASLGTLAWNDGVNARALPNCFWLRMPFFNNRARVSAIRALFF